VRILITGGRSRVAQAIALDREARGDEICLTASSESSCRALRDSCVDRGIRASCAVFDLAKPAAVSPGLDAQLRQAEGLILNAATAVETLDLFHRVPAGEVDAAVDADVKGNLSLLRAVLPGMAERGFGRIVFISSVSVAMGTSRYGRYCLTKAALEGLVLNLAVDYGHLNVLSNIVRLGVFRTGRTERFWSREKYARRAASLIPQGALGDVDALPEAIHPLLSARQYINGSVVTVAGGLPLLRSAGLAGREDE